eukprot:1716119-Alexandrium_andersonii.AAC.1
MSASLVGSEMCIRDRSMQKGAAARSRPRDACHDELAHALVGRLRLCGICLLYTSDAADDM